MKQHHSIGWTIGAALGALLIVLFFAMVAERITQVPPSPQATVSLR